MRRETILQTTNVPLAATLKRISATEAGEEMGLDATVGVPEEPGWMPATGLVSDAEALEELLARIGRAYGTENRLYTTTALLRGYLWRALIPTVAAFLLERRAPDPGADNLALRFDERGYPEGLAFRGPRFAALPDDPDAGHPDAVVLSSEEEQLFWLRDRISPGLPGLFAVLRRARPRRGERVLWGVAVDSCAEAFLHVGEAFGRQEEACAHAETMLSGSASLSGPTNYFVLEHTGGAEPTRIRNACCLHYKTGNEACFTCPRTTDRERHEILAAT